MGTVAGGTGDLMGTVVEGTVQVQTEMEVPVETAMDLGPETVVDLMQIAIMVGTHPVGAGMKTAVDGTAIMVAGMAMELVGIALEIAVTAEMGTEMETRMVVVTAMVEEGAEMESKMVMETAMVEEGAEMEAKMVMETAMVEVGTGAVKVGTAVEVEVETGVVAAAVVVLEAVLDTEVGGQTAIVVGEDLGKVVQVTQYNKLKNSTRNRLQNYESNLSRKLLAL